MNSSYFVIPGLVLAWALPPAAARAQTTPPAAPDRGELSRKIVDPTASLKTFGFRWNHTEGYHGNSGESANQIQFQPVIPFEAFGVPNILRLTATGTLDGPGDAGINDVSVFNLFVINESWGRWAFGPVLDFVIDPLPGGDRVTAGPAVGAVASQGKWTFGLFNQNFLGSDTRLSSLQPVVGYQLGGGYSLSAGDAQFTYDWNSGQWVNLPLGISLNKVSALGGVPVKYSINPEYNFREVRGTSQFTVRCGISLIF